MKKTATIEQFSNYEIANQEAILGGRNKCKPARKKKKKRVIRRPVSCPPPKVEYKPVDPKPSEKKAAESKDW